MQSRTHMDCSWEGLTLSQDGESVGQIGDVVFAWNILSFQSFETLKMTKIDVRYRNSRVFFQIEDILTLSGAVGSALAT